MVRLTDRPDMTKAVYRECKTTATTTNISQYVFTIQWRKSSAVTELLSINGY